LFVGYGFLTVEEEEGEIVKVTVEKPYDDGTLGIALRVQEGALYVNDITPTGVFAYTPLEINDLVLSINNISFRHNPDALNAGAVVENAQATVTLVVVRKPARKYPRK
jgi:S1-C subfamily serine protease